MAEIEKVTPQTQKVWTAQDFRERNERLEAKARELAKKRVETELIPEYIKRLNEAYASSERKRTRINISTYSLSKDEYEIRFINEWAKSLGYELDVTTMKGIALVVPDKPAFDEPEAEKYEDS